MVSKDWKIIVTRCKLRGMLEGKDYKASDRVIRFVARFTDSCIEHEMTAPMMRVPTQYADLSANVTKEMGQWAWSVEELSSIYRRLEVFEM